MATRKVKKPAKVSVKSESVRTVGPLSIFGFKEYWRVPAIVPKEYWDYSELVVDFAKLVPDQFACVGGVTSNCRELEAVDDQPTPSAEFDATESDEDDGDALLAASAELSDDEGEQIEEQDEDFDSVETDASGKTVRIKTWTFTLTGENRNRPISIEMKGSTKAQLLVIEKAQAGEVVYLYGQAFAGDAGLSLINCEHVELGDIGTIHARYPSKSKKEFPKSITKTRSGVRRPRRKPKPIVRTISSDNVAIRIRERLDGSIKKTGEVLRKRLDIKPGAYEWELLRKLQPEVKAPILIIESLIRSVHEPKSIEAGLHSLDAVRKLAALDVLKEIERNKNANLCPQSRVRCTREAFAAAVASLKTYGKLVMTDEQNFAAWEICSDLDSYRQMHRCLSGDVGTGKTLVFGVVAAVACADEKLVVILEPRKQLAEQIFEKVRRYWPHLDSVLVTGKSGEVRIPKSGIVVGTTGIWKRLEAAGVSPDLIICDEQQKFGTTQRFPWAHTFANLLEATATPIPRTQALLKFGGIDVSRLEFCHIQKNVETILVKGAIELKQTYDTVANNIRHKGMNLILVYPAIFQADEEEVDEDPSASSGNPPKALLEAFEYWNDRFPDRVAVIHGQLDGDMNSRAIKQFTDGDIDVIMGTTILEVGLDFPMAPQMIIHHPESMGVSAVHQLRGRLARQGGDGWCYLAVKPGAGDLSMMQMMTSEKNGLKLATQDMILRGHGDLRHHAKQQSGEFEGFLVGTQPTVSDYLFVSHNCTKWIKGEGASSDLIGTDEKTTKFMAKMSKARRKLEVTSPVIEPAQNGHVFEQTGLF